MGNKFSLHIPHRPVLPVLCLLSVKTFCLGGSGHLSGSFPRNPRRASGNGEKSLGNDEPVPILNALCLDQDIKNEFLCVVPGGFTSLTVSFSYSKIH